MRSLDNQQAEDNQHEDEAARLYSLVRRSTEGDLDAFSELYQLHHARIYALCWRMCSGQHALAEDLLQETFVKAWQKLHTFRGDAGFATWLHRIAVNTILADKRRNKMNMLSVDQKNDFSSDLDKLQSSNDSWQGADAELEAAIARLPQRAREVLILFSIEGYSHEEISALTNMAVGSSKAQLHRARQLLKTELELQ